MQTEYWQERFGEFGLHGVLNDFPENRDAVFEAVERLQENVVEYATE